MEEVFERFTGAKTELSFDKSLPDPDSKLVVVDGIVDNSSLPFAVKAVLNDYKISRNYINTNPNAALYR